MTRRTIYKLKKDAKSLPPDTIPERKEGSGSKKKTTERVDKILKPEVMSNPYITATQAKKKCPAMLQDVSVRTIQHRLQKDQKMSSRRTAKKPF